MSRSFARALGTLCVVIGVLLAIPGSLLMYLGEFVWLYGRE